MDIRKKFTWQKLVMVFAVTALIFVLGIWFGSWTAGQKLSIINDMEKDLRTDTTAVELQYLLLAEDPCMAVNHTPLTDELYSIARRLDYMENSLGEDNKDVLRLKNYYSTLQIRHWMLMREMQEKCQQNLTLVLYFYDTKEDCRKCEQQGFILTYLRKKYPDIFVYAFYIDLNNAAIETIKSMYGIKDAPTVLVDGEKLEGFQSKDAMLEKINNK